ncbi:7302_t:CDS:10 [Gigaspora margarita]|uniref:7302_t:CDS:1 n=1 Tax=Gigaspora margarita TaxID=4874 RepID=A0ABN7VEW4_GIGMA|nr:7302_t:CDS:10 [Gigaspora margarita]
MKEIIIIETQNGKKVKEFLEQEHENYRVYQEAEMRLASQDEQRNKEIAAWDKIAIEFDEETVGTELKANNGRDGKIMVDQIKGIDKERLRGRAVSRLTENQLEKINEIMLKLFKLKFRGVGKSTLSQALAVEAKKKKLSVLLADCDSQQATRTLEIAKRADLIIQPTGASRADLVPAVKEFNALKKAGIPTKKLLFILTRLSTPAEAKAVQEYLKKTGYACSDFYLMEKASYKQVQNEGKSITQTKYQGLAKQAKELVEASENIKAPELAPKDNRFTGRNKRISFTSHPEFAEKLRKLAFEENCYQIEILEKALECYEKHRKTINREQKEKPQQCGDKVLVEHLLSARMGRFDPSRRLENAILCDKPLFDKKKQLCRSHNKQNERKTKFCRRLKMKKMNKKPTPEEKNRNKELVRFYQAQIFKLTRQQKYLLTQLDKIQAQIKDYEKEKKKVEK